MNTRITGLWPLGLASLAALVALMLLGWANMVGRTEFLGIAESKEIIINSEAPVEIEKFYVLEGQSVDRGQLLVQLGNPELTLKINQISHQLDQYRAQNDVDKTELQSVLTRLEAEKKALIDETNYQIQELKNDYNLNMSLASGLQSIPAKNLINRSSAADHPTLQKIERLRLELASAVQLYDVRIELQKKAIASSDKPISIQINQLEKELVMLKAENGKLSIYAPISGVIGSINFKAGEKVSPFAAVMTLHSKTPSIVKGYLREDEFSKVQVNDTLMVHSITDSGSFVEGAVVGVGSRIVEYPVRLRKHQNVQSWGREITIKIPECNNLILGEKVLVSLNDQNKTPWRRFKQYFFTTETIAGTVQKDAVGDADTETLAVADSRTSSFMTTVNSVRPIQSVSKDNLEASAMVYLPEFGQFLMASDETTDQSPVLYLMDLSGQITREITIDGVDKIDDVESMTRDDEGTIYIAASMSARKNKSYPLSRRLLLSIKQSGDKSFHLHKSVDLSNILTRCAHENINEPWAGFIIRAVENGKLDMEGMFWHENDLYLGFKSPLYMKRSIILKIENCESLFDNRHIDGEQVSIWQMLRLRSEDYDITERISDLLLIEDTLFITGVVRAEERNFYTGSLWRLDIRDGNLKQITRFKDLKPEGIAETNKMSDLMVCFDLGSKRQSQIALIKGVR